jgi:hypothetical protein
MGESDTAAATIGLVVILIGAGMMIGSGAFLYRNSIRQSELERALDHPLKSLDPQRLTDGVRAAAADPATEPADLLALQVRARNLCSQRVYPWVFAGVLMQQLGSLIQRPSPARLTFVALIALITLAATVRVERNARSAAVLLRRHPLSPEVGSR